MQSWSVFFQQSSIKNQIKLAIFNIPENTPQNYSCWISNIVFEGPNSPWWEILINVNVDMN